MPGICCRTSYVRPSGWSTIILLALQRYGEYLKPPNIFVTFLLPHSIFNISGTKKPPMLTHWRLKEIFFL